MTFRVRITDLRLDDRGPLWVIKPRRFGSGTEFTPDASRATTYKTRRGAQALVDYMAGTISATQAEVEEF